MEITVRRAKPADVPALVRLQIMQADYHTKLDNIYKRGRQLKPAMTSFVKKELRKRLTRTYVAEANGKIVGQLICKINKTVIVYKPRRIGYLSSIHVDPTARRLGIGRKLITEALAWFKKEKLQFVEVSASSNNKIGLSFWNKNSFKEVSKRMRLKI